MSTLQATMAEDIVLFSPDTHNPPIDLDLGQFMGTWHVTHSTLPLWKSRKDVSITYAMKTTRPGEHIKFDDIVEFRSKKDAPSSTPSRVVGVDKLAVRPDANTPSGSGGAPPTSTGRASDLSDTGAHARGARPAPTRYKWRGKGWLVITSSRWQVLGCSRDVSPANAQAWAVTYFEKTLFTPAGLDVYARTPRGLPGELLGAIVAQVRALGGEVAKLAERFFEVERSGVSSEPAPATVPLTVAASDASKVDADADALERRSETGTEEETGERGEDARQGGSHLGAEGGRVIGKVNKIDLLNHMALTPS